MSTDTWQQEFAKHADETLQHPIVAGVMAELLDNLGVSAQGLPAYGLAKVAHYAAQVARAQALGLDPEVLRDGVASIEEDRPGEVYRMRVGVRSGGASWGDWRYYETFDALRVAALEAHLDVTALGDESRRRGIGPRLAQLWRRDRPETPHVTRVYAVERHTDAGWQPIQVHVIEPAVLLTITHQAVTPAVNA